MATVATEEKVNKQEMSHFAHTIYKHKYAMKFENGSSEEWEDTAKRVVTNVMASLGYKEDDEKVQKLINYLSERKFLPGGRYLYASGRPFHQTQNCLLLRAEDSREGWADLVQKATMALMTGAGIGIDYSDLREEGAPIRKTGGTSSGPISLMNMINEVGRNVMQGGSRRSAIWAGLRWSHPDVFKFIEVKNWQKEVRALKEKDFNFPAPMDMTNVSVILDKDFFDSYEDETNPMHAHAQDVYWKTLDRMVTTAEPGFSIDYENAKESLRNAPVAGNTHVLSEDGYVKVIDIVGNPTKIWTGVRWADDVIFEKTQENAPIVKVQFTGQREIRCEPSHEFLVERYVGAGYKKRLEKIERINAASLKEGDILHYSLPINPITTLNKDFYTFGYAYGDGSFTKAGGAEISLCSPESKKLVSNIVGFNSKTDEDSRGHTRIYFGVDERWQNRNKKEFPSEMYSEDLSNKASFIAGLFDADGNFDKNQKRVRLSNNNPEFLRGVGRILEDLGILASVAKNGFSTYGQKQTYQLSVMGAFVEAFGKVIPTERIQVDVEDWKPYRKSHLKVERVIPDGTEDVYCADVKYSEHSFMAEGVIISNCTEVVSEDDSDICNLGSINFARVESLEELRDVTNVATLFLLAGTVYSDLPYAKVREVREQNRRLGLGFMGVHEWLLKRGHRYGPNDELSEWLSAWEFESDRAAQDYALEHDLSIPVKVRAIAPTGCQRPDTLILTEEGILELDELGKSSGEKWQPLNLDVFQENGDQKKSSRFFVNGNVNTKKILLSSGVELESTDNHQYRVLENGKYLWKRADSLKNNDAIVVSLGSYKKETEPDLISISPFHHNEKEIIFPTSMTEDLAKFIGIFIGDGSIHSKGIRIACNALEDRFKEVINLGKTLFGIEPTVEQNDKNCISVCFNSSVLLRWLYVNGLDKKKSNISEIPLTIRRSSFKSIIAFLDGLWFADGSQTGSVKYFDTASQKLSNQLVVVLRAIGKDATITTHLSGLGSKIYRVSVILTVRKGVKKEHIDSLSKFGLINSTLDFVRSVENSSSMTLDIEVPETKTYIANGVVSHNTIGIIAETTTGIEPIFCVAYKRRYLDGKTWKHQYVVDPTAQRLVESGIDPHDIEDAHTLSYDVERRLEFQAWVQKYVDHGISSTINLPYPIKEEEEQKDFGNMLLKYLPKLRGVTCYPDGARGGQPLTPVTYNTAIHKVGVIFESEEETCVGGVCGV